MGRYVVVTDADEIVNIILIDDLAGFDPGPGLRVVAEADVNAAWRMRADDAAPVRVITPLAFRRRFTDAERGAITLAASRGLDAGDATLQVWLDDLNSATEVDMDLPEVAEAMAMLVAAGLVVAARAEEIVL